VFEDDIDDGRIPKCPVCFKNNQISKMEKDFLEYLNIPDDKSSRQFAIDHFKVDGIKGNKIFEFLGDYWHGNPSRYPPNKVNRTNKKTFGDLYKSTINNLHTLSKLGYRVYYMWETDWLDWLQGKRSTFPLKCYYPI
jgi:hypothetical protein